MSDLSNIIMGLFFYFKNLDKPYLILGLHYRIFYLKKFLIVFKIFRGIKYFKIFLSMLIKSTLKILTGKKGRFLENLSLVKIFL